MSKHIYFVLNDRNVNIDLIVSTGYEREKPKFGTFEDGKPIYSIRLANGENIYLQDEQRIKDIEACLGI